MNGPDLKRIDLGKGRSCRVREELVGWQIKNIHKVESKAREVEDEQLQFVDIVFGTASVVVEDWAGPGLGGLTEGWASPGDVRCAEDFMGERQRLIESNVTLREATLIRVEVMKLIMPPEDLEKKSEASSVTDTNPGPASND